MYGNNKISVIRYVKRLPKTNWNPCFEGWKEERVRSAIKHGDLAYRDGTRHPRNLCKSAQKGCSMGAK